MSKKTKKKTKKKDKDKSFLNPQQEAALFYYTDPLSLTWGNLYQSLIKAKYSETYAKNFTQFMPEWLLDNIGDSKRLNRAEKNLAEIQNLEIRDKDGKIDTAIIVQRTKVDMFIAERLNKAKYSTRSEFTGKGGKDLTPSSLEDLSNDELENILKARS